MRVLGLVPARGGSKGIPRKNLRLLGGRPLLAWTAETALATPALSRVVLSSEDAEIAEVGRSLGLEVPFLRPAELATDEAPTFPVVRHAVETLEAAGDRFDAVCLLQPTCPFRPPGLVERCVARLDADPRLDAVVTVLPVPAEHHPAWVYLADGDGRLRLALGGEAPVPRRQELPPAFHRDGSVYLTRRSAIAAGSLYGRALAGEEVDPAEAVNLDCEADWARAEAILAARRGGRRGVTASDTGRG